MERSNDGCVRVGVFRRRYEEVAEALQNPDTPSKDIGKLSKELGRLTPAVELYGQFQELTSTFEELQALQRDGGEDVRV